ncbi:hypothetical protein [Catellatospora paridis]|uniref:hypothetical protein n=1 Tax=Catellatospora paridis TaxID=1617086 RepID=UPI0012D4707B|nr:hypothetical protein [Catellatospora paridis]
MGHDPATREAALCAGPPAEVEPLVDALTPRTRAAKTPLATDHGDGLHDQAG